MLGSHSKKFIYFHLYKTGGTSMRTIIEKYSEFRGGKHDRPAKFISQFGKQVYDDYYTMSFVRNPFDWQVSLYFYMLKDVSHPQHQLMKKFKTFDEYIDWRASGKDLITQYEFLSEGSSNDSPLTIDYIGKFENMNENIEFIKNKFGMAGNLPHLNKTNHKPFMDYYNERTIPIMKEAFKIDFETFGYE